MNDRVRKNTSDERNRKIDQKIKESIASHASSDSSAITNRIKELDKEWDTERVLEVNMPIVALIGLALGAFVHPYWLAFPAVVLLFFLQHAIQGWCPPLPIFRSLGYRTKQEIHKEKYALKLLRGDFDNLHGNAGQADSDALFEAVSK
jgi:hypothetical protein